MKITEYDKRKLFELYNNFRSHISLDKIEEVYNEILAESKKEGSKIKNPVNYLMSQFASDDAILTFICSLYHYLNDDHLETVNKRYFKEEIEPLININN